jgi:hypothetical protein
MSILDRILGWLLGPTVEVICKCGQKYETSEDAAEVIKKHGCWKCQLKRREETNRKVGTEEFMSSDAKQRFKIWDGMTWPLPDNDLAWRLTFAPHSVTQTDQLYLASVLSAYWQMIHDGRSKGESVCKTLREEIHK